MSKQTVTGVAEGHLLHKDFLVEYDPDERTWTVEREVPAEPTPEPGTAGTATVRGVEGVRVMRTDGTDGADEMWLSAVFILGYRGHQAEHVTDFVPDDQGKYRALLATVPNRAEYAEKIRGLAAQRDDARRALADVGTFVTEIDTDILHDGSYAEILRAEFKALGAAYDEATDRAIVAERDARAEHAEVERLRAENSALTNVNRDFREEVRVAEAEIERLWERLGKCNGCSVETGGPNEDCSQHGRQYIEWVQMASDARVSTPAVTTPGTETPAETPAPAAFVLPDLYALTMIIANDSPLQLPPARRKEVEAAARRVHGWLADRAVTEVGLTAALKATWTLGGMDAVRATRILAHLTGKAAS